jgi:pilus assembly protein CpaC
LTIACCSALTLGLCAAPMLRAQAAAGASIQDSTNDLYVAVGKTVLVDCVRPLTRVAVGLGDIAEATAVSPTEVMVSGKAAGETSLILWDVRGGRQFFNVTVRPSEAATDDSLQGVRRELRLQLPGQKVDVSYENGTVFLRGTANDMTSSHRAEEIAGTAGKVVNMLNVNVPANSPQIMLKVRFASVDRTKARSLGINLFNLGLGNSVSGITTGQFSPPSITSSGGSSATGSAGSVTLGNELNLLAFFPGMNAGADIEALESKGVVELLAEPNLIAANGKQASFLAGGEFPYPVVAGSSGGLAAVSIEFKEYGVRLNFIPTITPRGTIRLQVAPEVSALDYTNEVTISGFEVPGIQTRRVNTEVDLQDGQSFMIGGLLDKGMSETFDKIPFLADIPILGKFFQSQVKNHNDTELIVIVTPEIVAPQPAGQPLPDLHYPEAFMPPNSPTPMHHPDAKTAENTPAPAPASVPVETMIDSMKPEKPLAIESTNSTFGSGSTISSGSSSSGSSSSSPQ